MTTTQDTIDAFFGQQVTRVRVWLGTTGREISSHRGTNPAQVEGSAEDIYTRCYTRRETVPMARTAIRRYRGF